MDNDPGAPADGLDAGWEGKEGHQGSHPASGLSVLKNTTATLNKIGATVDEEEMEDKIHDKKT